LLAYLAADKEYATRAAYDLVREKFTLLLQRVYLANHTVDIVPEVSRDYYPPTTPWYEFDDPFDWEFSQIGKVPKPGSRGR
jgi:hypothetical protein